MESRNPNYFFYKGDFMQKHFINDLLHQLNSISRMAAIENAAATQHQIIMLTEYFRYKFGRENQIVKLFDELHAVNNLISLYKCRVGDTLIYLEEADPDGLEIYVPHYTVMTFVENCLHHAFENKEGIWQIRLCVNRKQNEFCISIEDNGVGYDGFDRLLQGVDPNHSVPSMINRLIHYCNSTSDIVTLQSTLNIGTTVLICMTE
jgi:LytS/YehU family sensor histidine kinase